jgi:hypothetical protein
MSHPRTQSGQPYEKGKGPGYETSDLSIPAILKFGIGFALFITIAHLIMIVMFFVMRQEKPGPVTPLSPPSVQVRSPVVGPQLEVHPTANWEEMHAAEERMLYGPQAYGWINPQTGVVRIPIDLAMDLALQRGFPTRPTATQAVPRMRNEK